MIRYRLLRFSSSWILSQLDFLEGDMLSRIGHAHHLSIGSVKDSLEEARLFLTYQCGYSDEETHKLILKNIRLVCSWESQPL